MVSCCSGDLSWTLLAAADISCAAGRGAPSRARTDSMELVRKALVLVVLVVSDCKRKGAHAVAKGTACCQIFATSMRARSMRQACAHRLVVAIRVIGLATELSSVSESSRAKGTLVFAKIEFALLSRSLGRLPPVGVIAARRIATSALWYINTPTFETRMQCRGRWFTRLSGVSCFVQNGSMHSVYRMRSIGIAICIGIGTVELSRAPNLGSKAVT